MALDIYFKEDIANVVQSNAFSVIQTAAASGAANVEFVKGALTTAQSICIAFGVDWRKALGELREQAELGGWHNLLDTASVPILEGAKQ